MSKRTRRARRRLDAHDRGIDRHSKGRSFDVKAARLQHERERIRPRRQPSYADLAAQRVASYGDEIVIPVEANITYRITYGSGKWAGRYDRQPATTT